MTTVTYAGKSNKKKRIGGDFVMHSMPLEKIARQAQVLRSSLAHFSYDGLEMYAKKLPQEADGFLLFPDWKKIDPQNKNIEYTEAIKILIGLLENQGRKFSEDFIRQLDAGNLKRGENVENLVENLRKKQSGNIYIAAAQFSGENRIATCHAPKRNEMGLGVFEALVALLTHKDYLHGIRDLGIRCTGDILVLEGGFKKYVPSLIFTDGKITLIRLLPEVINDLFATPTLFV